MNTNLSNALTNLAKFVADKAGLITLNNFNKEVTHDLWVKKMSQLAALDLADESLALSHEEVRVARKAIQTYVGDYIHLPVAYWTMIVLQQAYACKGLSIDKVGHILYVAKTTRPWAAPEALQSLTNTSSGFENALGYKESQKMIKQIARSQAIRESGLAVIKDGGDGFDLLRGVIKGWKGADVKQTIQPAVPTETTTTAKVVGLK